MVSSHAPTHDAAERSGAEPGGRDLLIRNAELDGRRSDVHISRGRIARIGARLDVPEADVIDARGAAVLPGLHDHHIHVLALAASLESVRVGPPEVSTPEALRQALLVAAAAARDPHGWIRAVGYHECVAGLLDRHAIDALVADRPVRIQYRTGTMWMLNSRAVDMLGLSSRRHPAVERDERGDPTGRVTAADDILRGLGGWEPPNVRRATDLLLSFGVTGATDATPFDDVRAVGLLHPDESLRPRIVITGGVHLPFQPGRGPMKLVVADHGLPTVDQLAAGIRAARSQRRPVAMHCVTGVALVLALAAWEEVGVVEGDRIEHGGVIDIELVPRLAELGLTVVTQPNFISERGDQYLRDVDQGDLPNLYRCASLLAAGVRVGGGTDAPFGHPDPWRAIVAAVRRTTPGGVVLGQHERTTPARALELFLGPLEDPGGPARRVCVGAPADLCVVDGSLSELLAEPDAQRVRATVVAGRIAYWR